MARTRRTRWAKATALTATGVTVLSLAACSSSGPSSRTSGDNAHGGAASEQTTQAVAATDAILTGPAPEIKDAHKGGTLYLDDSSNPPTMDPSGIYYTDSNAFASQFLFRTLTQYKMVHGKPVLVPDLAQGVGTESADGLTWTFKIKPGLTYSDGSPVRIADFVYAIKRSFAKESVAANGTNYQQQFLKGGSTYKGPFLQPAVDFPGVTSQGGDTLVFHLTQRVPSFNYFASFPEFSPIPQSKDSRGAYQRNPLTTGPYRVDSYTLGQRMILSRNPHWDPGTDPVRHDYPDKIQINFSVTDLTSQQRILANSGVGSNSLNIGSIDASLAGKVTGPQRDQFVIGPSPCTYYVELDSRKIPLEIRKAVGYAYPFNQVRKAGGSSTLNYQPATTFAAQSLQGFRQYPALPYATGQGNGDPAKAKAILTKLGKVGYQLSYYYRSDKPASVAANTAKKAGLEKAGFTVKDIPVSTAEFTKKIADSKAPVNMGQGTGGWCYDWPTGDSVYPPMFSGAGIADGQSIGQFTSAAVNQQMAAIGKLAPAAAGPKWAALDQELMTEYVPALPDYYSMNTATFGKNVKNVELNPVLAMPSLAQLWVSK